MFIASKVNTYLNVRNQPTTDGTIIGKLTKYSGGELVEDMGNGWWHISSGGIDGYIWSENCVTGEYNIGEEWRNYTVDGGIRLCLYSFRLKTTGLSRIAR